MILSQSSDMTHCNQDDMCTFRTLGIYQLQSTCVKYWSGMLRSYFNRTSYAY